MNDTKKSKPIIKEPEEDYDYAEYSREELLEHLVVGSFWECTQFSIYLKVESFVTVLFVKDEKGCLEPYNFAEHAGQETFPVDCILSTEHSKTNDDAGSGGIWRIELILEDFVPISEADYEEDRY